MNDVAELTYPQTKEAWVALLKEDVSQFNAAHAAFRAAHPLQRLDLSGADLSTPGVQNAQYRGADLANTDMKGCNLSGTEFTQCDLRNACLDYTHNAPRNGFGMVHFMGCNMQHASFRQAMLQMPSFQYSDLLGATFREARLYLASFEGANLAYANIKGAIHMGSNLAGASYDSREQWEPLFQVLKGSPMAKIDPEPRIVTPSPAAYAYDAAQGAQVAAALDAWMKSIPLDDESKPGKNLGAFVKPCELVTDPALLPKGTFAAIKITSRVGLNALAEGFWEAFHTAGIHNRHEDFVELRQAIREQGSSLLIPVQEAEKLVSAIANPDLVSKIATYVAERTASLGESAVRR